MNLNLKKMNPAKQYVYKMLDEEASIAFQESLKDDDYYISFINNQNEIQNDRSEDEYNITIYPFYFTEKPNHQIQKITNKFKETYNHNIQLNDGRTYTIGGGITKDDLINTIEAGYSFIPATYSEYCFIKRNSKSDNINEAAYKMIVIDIDNTKDNPASQELIINNMSNINSAEFDLTASFYYETFSSSIDCPKMRFVYFLDREYTTLEYKKIITVIKYDTNIIDLNKTIGLDTACFNTSRIFHATNQKCVELSSKINTINMNLISQRFDKIQEDLKQKEQNQYVFDKETNTYIKINSSKDIKYFDCDYIKEWQRLNDEFLKNPSKVIKALSPILKKDDHTFKIISFYDETRHKKMFYINRPSNILAQQLLFIFGNTIQGLLNYIKNTEVKTNFDKILFNKKEIKDFCDKECCERNKERCPLNLKTFGKSNIKNDNALTKEDTYLKLGEVIDNFLEKNHKESLHFLSVQTGTGKTKYVKDKLNKFGGYKNHKIIIACDTHKLCLDYYNDLLIKKQHYYPKFLQFDDVISKHNLNVNQKDLYKMFHSKNISSDLRNDIKELMEKDTFRKKFSKEIESNKKDRFIMTHHKLLDMADKIKNSVVIIDELPKFCEIIQPKYDNDGLLLNEYEIKQSIQMFQISEDNKECTIFIKDNIEKIKKLVKNKNKIIIMSATIPFEKTLNELFKNIPIKYTSIKTKQIGEIIQIPVKTTKDVLDSKPFGFINDMINEINKTFPENKIDNILTSKSLTSDVNFKELMNKKNLEVTDMYFYNNMGRNDFSNKNIMILGSSYINVNSSITLNSYFKKYYDYTKLNWGIEGIQNDSKRSFSYSNFLESQEIVQTIGRARTVQYDVRVFVVNDMFSYYSDVYNYEFNEDADVEYLDEIIFN